MQTFSSLDSSAALSFRPLAPLSHHMCTCSLLDGSSPILCRGPSLAAGAHFTACCRLEVAKEFMLPRGSPQPVVCGNWSINNPLGRGTLRQALYTGHISSKHLQWKSPWYNSYHLHTGPALQQDYLSWSPCLRVCFWRNPNQDRFQLRMLRGIAHSSRQEASLLSYTFLEDAH